ncbi:hypothetical protein LTR10_023060 [Elasticomyces elasticus]|uniref:BZIP domain-containing protein n=1 Tax=Exophiala sideris TaxID=1016849 RepID=A0ABR0IWM4_9EURO|nr:hypothetical protein LTR10_023060 [Elasticomyces elasticus]KAK5021095.1 hypothetical protein LTS07_011248 [Exophiala sideris]KAK5023293.1 hypothetical protein LTR13_011283 [Exophiala sideris]KAK5048798.1 hypothetical protein LTR69_011261 [Exophiala sideris]KAK5176265.1 hypothetical protein LTR44_011196 [Eurotiomycetes sp. CCFEE 6388]
MKKPSVITLVVKRTSRRPAGSGQTSSGSEGANSTRSRHEDSTQGRRRKDKEERRSSNKSKKSKNAPLSATQLQKQQREIRALVTKEADNQQMLLTSKYKCPRQNCKNNPRLCYEKPGSFGHLPISLPVSRMWADLIAEGKAIIDEAPTAILMAMMEQRSRKEKAQQPPHPSLSNLPQNSPNIMPGNTFYFGTVPPGLQQHQSGTAGTSANALPSEPRSSPPQREGDDDNNMMYISIG